MLCPVCAAAKRAEQAKNRRRSKRMKHSLKGEKMAQVGLARAGRLSLDLTLLISCLLLVLDVEAAVSYYF